jgi:hypothetical protein
MLLRGWFAVFLIAIFTIAAGARPPKRLHNDDTALKADSDFDLNLEESPRPRPDAVQTDPLVTARELACEPLVIRGFVMAWRSTLNGTRDRGLGESGFAVQSYRSSLSIQGWREASINDLFIPADEDTLAVAHVHGRAADEHPAVVDMSSRVPNFVISRDALYVTIPGKTQFIRLRGGVTDGDGWNKPCAGYRRALVARR